jgi:phosphohistidine phosphatase
VLCSTARRARETFEGIVPALGDGVEVRFEPGLYGASADELQMRLRTLPETIESALLIGHNPSIQTIALRVAGGGDELERVRRKYPTGALATLTLPGGWDQLEPGAAELVAFVSPKDLQ